MPRAHDAPSARTPTTGVAPSWQSRHASMALAMSPVVSIVVRRNPFGESYQLSVFGCSSEASMPMRFSSARAVSSHSHHVRSCRACLTAMFQFLPPAASASRS